MSYRIDSAGASFTLPATFSARNREPIDKALQEKREAAEGDAKRNMNCVSVPFTSIAKDADGVASVSVLQFDLHCSKADLRPKDLNDFAGGVVRGLSKGTRSEFLKPIRYRLGGMDAVFLRGVLYTATGHSTQIFLSCVLAEADVDCWEVTAHTQAQLRELAALPIRFDQTREERLVPEAIYTQAVPTEDSDTPAPKN